MTSKQQIQITNPISQLQRLPLGFDYDNTLQQVKRIQITARKQSPLRIQRRDCTIDNSCKWHQDPLCDHRIRTTTLIALWTWPVSYTHLRAHETDSYLVCRLLLEKK